jgi:hypothetical protein
VPCPFFEPKETAARPRHANARLPLIDEYEGVCHAGSEPGAPLHDVVFRYCNHGYSQGCCDRFPSHEVRSAIRYDVVSRNESALSLICIKEQDYTPVQWQAIEYMVLTERFEPELGDLCMRAQALAFCRSFLGRFADPAGNR